MGPPPAANPDRRCRRSSGLPSPPAEFSAVRHGDAVDVNFLVPSANTDGSRPANLTRVDVYAYTGPPNLTDTEVAGKLATKVGSSRGESAARSRC